MFFYKSHRPFCLFVLLTIFTTLGYSQQIEPEEAEGDLKILFDSLFLRNEIRFLRSDSEKVNLNDSILGTFREVLDNPSSFTYPFHQLSNCGIITSEDKRLRIINWNLKFSDGSFKYYGFIQYYLEDKDKIVTHELVDLSDSIIDPEHASLYPYNWYGALYYHIISYKEGGKYYYVLLGWDGNSYLTNKKIVDVLTFSSSGKAYFGKPVFLVEKERKKRIIFEHALRVSMLLRYDEKAGAIVFDHLSPAKPSQKGQYQFYGPDGSYDGLVYEKGKWVFVSDFYVTNPKVKHKSFPKAVSMDKPLPGTEEKNQPDEQAP